MRSRRHQSLRDHEAILDRPFWTRELRAFRESELGQLAAAEKLLFNIGRILHRQSRQISFGFPGRQILPPGRKRRRGRSF
jgi:hypothetical protein